MSRDHMSKYGSRWETTTCWTIKDWGKRMAENLKKYIIATAIGDTTSKRLWI